MRYLITAVLLFSLTACSHLEVNVNNMPAPNHILYVRNPSNGLELNLTTVLGYEAIEDDELYTAYKYVQPFFKGKLLANTVEIKVMVNIVNKNRIYYSLWKECKFYYPAEKKHISYSTQLYYGHLSHNYVTINLPLGIGLERCKVKLILKDKSGSELCTILDWDYTMEGEKLLG